MKPVSRTMNLMKLLGWQGGTIHDACREVGLEVNDFLYGEIDFGEDKCSPCKEFKRGYSEAPDIAIYISTNKGNLQYWFGAIACANNNFQSPDL